MDRHVRFRSRFQQPPNAGIQPVNLEKSRQLPDFLSNSSPNPIVSWCVRRLSKLLWSPATRIWNNRASDFKHESLFHPQTASLSLSTTRTPIQRRIQAATDFSAYALVRFLIAVVQTMPVDMGDSMCRSLATVITRWGKLRHQSTMDNLRRVFPDASTSQLHHLERSMWHSLLLMSCEVAWVQRRLHLTNWTQYIQFRGHREILKHFLGMRPTVSVTGHFGNFEVGGHTMGMMGCESTTIARRLDNPFLHRWVESFRSAHGQRMLDKNGCAMEVEQLLDQGGTLALLADQHGGKKGCWTRFLGVPASCHKALALFSLSSHAPMLVGYTRRIGSQPMRFESSVVAIADPEDDTEGVCESVTSLTEWYNRKLALAVDRSVEQYWWLHRRWRTPPPRVAKRLEKKREKSTGIRNDRSPVVCTKMTG